MTLVHDISFIYMISLQLLFRMRKITSIVFVSLLAFLSSCNSDVFQEHELGDNLIDNATEVILIDTFTVHSSTVKLDSLATSDAKNILFGQYQDPFFGKVTSDFYGILGLGDGFNLEKNNEGVIIPVEFDSLVFITYYDKRFYGDTLKEQSLSIHRVLEEMEFVDGSSSFYGHNTFDYDTEVLGDTTFYARPNKKRDNGDQYNLRIPMEPELGEKLVKMAMESNDTIRDSKKWQRFFEGIVLKAGDMDAAMLSFQTGDTLMKMRVYFSDLEGESTDVVKHYDFPVNKSNLNFSNYRSDKTDTPQDLGRIVDVTEDLSSDSTSNLAFVQGGIGLFTKIRIPYIEELNTLGLTGGILKAELIFYPKEGSYDDDQFMLPNNRFNIFTTNDKNRLFADQIIMNPATNSVVSSTYVQNGDNKNEFYYSMDVTNYINNILLMGQEYEDALLLLPEGDFGNSMERIVIENDKDSDFRIRLRATYVVQK